MEIQFTIILKKKMLRQQSNSDLDKMINWLKESLSQLYPTRCYYGKLTDSKAKSIYMIVRLVRHDSHRLSTDQKRMLSENALVPSESIYN